jgi:cobalt-zinc-cadmium efflux system membrane fusion protein
MTSPVCYHCKRLPPVRTRRRSASLAALAAALVLSACARTEHGAPAVANGEEVTLSAQQREHLHLYAVTASRYHRSVEANGAVDFDNDQATGVLAPFSGPVTRLLVAQGDQVKAGDALAVVDSPDFATAVGSYQKALATARTNRRLADTDKDLVQHNGVSEREQAQAQTDAENAEADRDAALQGLLALQVNPKTIKDIQAGRPVTHPPALIRAPIAGTVVEKLITPGELLQAGTTACFTIADLSRVWIMAQLFGEDLAAVSRGDPVQVLTGVGSQSFSGKVDKISDLVDPDTRAVTVRVVVDNPAHLLRKQTYVRVRIQSHAESSGILIPVSAVLRDDENLPFVYLAGANGSFARQHVRVGNRIGEQYEIAEGLQAGNQIVVEGGIFVQFMQSQ